MGYAEWHEREALSLRRHRADSPVMPELAEMHEGTAATLRALLTRAEAAEAQVKWWQADSAAGWNKCEERRLQAEQAEAECDALRAERDDWQFIAERETRRNAERMLESQAALAAALRKAAEAMREKAAEAVRIHIQETDPAPALACDLMDAIRALPLPGDKE